MFKVAILTPLPPWHSGGIERLVGEVARRLKKDFDIKIYCTDVMSGRYHWEGIPIYVFKGATLYRFSLPLYNAVKTSEFDLIHANGFSTFMPLAAFLTGKRYVLSPYFHPEAVAGSSYIIPRRIYARVTGYHIHWCAKSIVCNSNVEKNLILEKFRVPDSKVKVIYNGLDIQRISTAKPYNIDGRIVLTVGRLRKYKNVQRAIRVLKYLPKEYYLYIIGTGPYQLELKSLVKKLSLNDRVRFLGYLLDEEVYRWLKTCSVFIHLSKSETFGMTCIEALAAGRPVIVNNDNFGLQETAGLFDHIYIVDGDRISDRELSKVVDDVSQKQVNVDLCDFDWNTIAGRFREVYTTALEN